MSGRKKGEVSNLLSLGERSRDEINRNSNSIIANNIKKNKETYTSILDLEKQIKNINFEIDSSIKEAASIEELKKVIDRLGKEKLTISNYKFQTLENEINKKNEIDKEFSVLESQAKEIQNKIMYKSDYCDNEYSQASVIVNKYKKLKGEVENIKEKILNKTKLNNEVLLYHNIALENIKNLKKEFEIKTVNIINSNNLSLIKNVFEDIDESMAKKFLPDEYSILEMECKSLNKDNIESKFNKLNIELNSFRINLSNKYTEYKTKKDNAEKNLFELEELKNGFTLKNIQSQLNGKIDMMDMYSFAEEYNVRGVSKENYENNLEKIKNLIKKEDFDLASSFIDRAKKELLNDQLILDDEYERIIKQIEYSKKIAESGKDLGYRIDTRFAEGGIQNGINIKFTMGDEIIEFEPRIDENQNLHLDIDHTESVSGTCGTNMAKIREVLQSKGLIVEDITKNGKSVIHRDRVVNSTVNTKNGTKGFN